MSAPHVVLAGGQDDLIAKQIQPIMAWDLTDVVRYLTERKKMDAAAVSKLITEYRKYLALCFLFPDTHKPISRAVDEVWHTHILFTRDYTAMGESIFGRYLHHNPARSEAEAANLAPLYLSHTIVEYTRVFGAPDQEIWPVDGSVCKESCDD